MTDEAHIDAYVGGYTGPSFSIRSSGSRIEYEHAGHFGEAAVEQVTLDTPEDELEVFWAEVDALCVWDWGPDYVDPNVRDGTQWSVVLERGGRRMESSGSNAYPEGFERLCAALSRLCGGRPFE